MNDLLKNEDNSALPLSIFMDIHILLQKFYIMRRLIRSKYEAGSLNISEAQTLFQTFIEPGISPSKLSQILQLEKSTISRLLKNIKQKGFINIESSKNDKRGQSIYLTKKGEQNVKQIQESNNKILNECLKSLNIKEQYELGSLLNNLADGLNCTAASYLPGDHPVTLAIVRLGRGTGMTGSSFMGTNFTSTQFHILLSIKESSSCTLTELSEKLPIDKSHISRGLSKLKKINLISTNKIKKSSKEFLLLTNHGEITLHQINLAGENLIKNGFKNYDINIPIRLKNLLQNLNTPNNNLSNSSILQERIEIKPITSLDDRRIARGMLIDFLIKTNSHFETPDFMYHPENLCYGLYIENHLVAACEKFKNDNSNELSNMTQAPQLDQEILESFKTKVLEIINTSNTHQS